MRQMVDDLIQKIDDVEFKVMSKLEDKVFYDDNKEAEKELAKMCQKHGFTVKEFIYWCEEY